MAEHKACERSSAWARPAAFLALKYVTSSTLHFLKGTDDALGRGDYRLNLYKDLQSTYDIEGEAVMRASKVVGELVKLNTG